MPENKVVLIVTLGTRELQFKNVEKHLKRVQIGGHKERTYLAVDGITVDVKPNYEFGTYCLTNPREGGRTLNEHFDLYHQFLSYPIIKPILQYVLNEKGKIDFIIFVITNQQDAKDSFKKYDTLYFPDVLEKLIAEDYDSQPWFANLEFDEYTIFEKATDVDYLYDHFLTELKGKVFFDDDEGDINLYFASQGGIDQINQALQLRLIERYPDISIVENNASTGVKRLQFPQRFILNSKRQTLKRFVEEFHFSSAWASLEEIKRLTQTQPVRALLNLARFRKEFDYVQALNCFKQYQNYEHFLETTWVDNYVNARVEEDCFDFTALESSRFRLVELLSLAELYLQHTNQYALGIVLFYRFVEEIGKAFVKEEGKLNLDYWQDRISFMESNQLGKRENYGVPALLQYGKRKSKGDLNKLFGMLEKTVSHANGQKDLGLNVLRSQSYFAHNLKPVTKADVHRHVKDFLNEGGLFQQILKLVNMPQENSYFFMRNTILNEIELL
jgi:hypothetical protein